MMEDGRFEYLVERYLEDSLTEDEAGELLHSLEHEPGNTTAMLEAITLSTSATAASKIHEERVLQAVMAALRDDRQNAELRERVMARIQDQPAPQQQPPGQLRIKKHLGNYEILEKVGQGAMGAVFKAKQVSMDRIVALKLLPPRLAANKKFVERFLREARSAGRCNHANLIHVHDVGQLEDFYFYSMEFVGGADLKQVLKKAGPLDEATAVRYMIAVAGALGAAHAQGIVHRDVKPDNIILDEAGNPKLGDLGLAKPMSGDADVTMGGAAMGTPHYMSPEQARGEPADARSDLYALGATFHHLLSGKTLFSAPTSSGVMIKHAGDPPPPIRGLRPDVSRGLEAVLLKLLEKDPDKRYDSAQELVDDLMLVQTNQRPRNAGLRTTRSMSAVSRHRREGGSERRRGSERREALPPESGSGKVPAIVGGIAAVLVIGVGLIVALGGQNPSPAPGPGAAAGDRADRAAKTPAVSTGSVGSGQENVPAQASGTSDDGKGAEEMIQYALNRHAENPTEWATTIEWLEKARAAGQGTAAELKAETKIAEMRGRWRQAAESELTTRRQQANLQQTNRDFDAALAALAGFPAHLEEPVTDELLMARQEVHDAAKAHIAGLLERVEQKLEAEDLDSAVDLVPSLDQVQYTPGREQTRRQIEEVLAQVKQMREAEAAAAERAARDKLKQQFKEIEKLLQQGEYTEARVRADSAAQNAEGTSTAGMLRALADLGAVFAARDKYVRTALQRMVGRDVRFETINRGRVVGRMTDLSGNVMTIESDIIVNRTKMGSQVQKLPLSELTSEQLESLAKDWPPQTTEGQMALAYQAVFAREPDAAEEAAAEAAEHPLASRIGEHINILRKGEIEVAAEEAWAALANRVPSRMTDAGAHEYMAELEGFREEYSATDAYTTVRSDWQAKYDAAFARTEEGRLIASMPDGAVTFNGNGYKLVSDALSWRQAKAACEKVGGHLVTIGSAAEHRFLAELLSRSKVESAWVGFGKTAGAAGNQGWVTGETTEYRCHGMAWNGAPEDTVAALPALSGGKVHRLEKVIPPHNTMPRAWICEWEDGAPVSKGGLDDTVVFNGHAYRLFTRKVDWQAAKAACEGMGGSLVMIGSKAENDYLIAESRKHGGDFWLGMVARDAEGPRWLNGGALTFTNWKPGEPNDRLPYAGRLTSDGLWRGTPMSFKIGFICEWETAEPTVDDEEAGEAELPGARDLVNGRWTGRDWIRFHADGRVESREHPILAKERWSLKGSHLILGRWKFVWKNGAFRSRQTDVVIRPAEGEGDD